MKDFGAPSAETTDLSSTQASEKDITKYGHVAKMTPNITLKLGIKKRETD